MKYTFFILLMITSISCSYTQKSFVNQIDETYKQSHTFDDCPRRLGFSRNTSTTAWVYPGGSWKLAKIDIGSFSELSDSLILSADFNAMYQEVGRNGKPRKTMNVAIGDYVVAKYRSRVNNYYVFKFVDQIGEKVKLEHHSYRIKSRAFYSLEDVDKIKYCVLESDLKTLEELVIEDKMEINICEKMGGLTTTPLSLAISKGNRKAFDKLIELGANIDQPCRGNRTALMKASKNTDTYYFERLIELGADVNIKDHRGKTVYEYLKNYKNFDLLGLIE